MQIRYRITLVFTVIVTIILLLLCTSLYFISENNRTKLFRERLVIRANNTADLLFKMSPQLVKEFNESSTGALLNKTIIVYDSTLNKVFSYYDSSSDSTTVSKELLLRAKRERYVAFEIGPKDAIAVTYTKQGASYLIVTAAYDEDRFEWLSRFRIILISAFILSVSIVVLSGYIFSIRLVRSISEITNRVNDISSANFKQRLNAGDGKDELQKLAITINNLLDRLKASFDTERRFIDNASHELSTPLASISSQIDVVLQRERDPEDYRNVFRSVHDDVRRLNLLVKSLLEIAKLSGSAKGIDLTRLRIDELLMRLPSEMQKINADYEVKLLFNELPDNEEALVVYAHEELLFSALKNIVHNACKFSGDGKAFVDLGFHDSKLKIDIRDNGPGISAEEHSRIFQPFYRSAETQEKVSGSGLGLSLAYQIIRLYGGTIELQSVPGQGSTFTIMIQNRRK